MSKQLQSKPNAQGNAICHIMKTPVITSDMPDAPLANFRKS